MVHEHFALIYACDKMSTATTIVNPRNGELAFKICSAEQQSVFDHLTRYNYYCTLWIRSGQGIYKCDFSEYKFVAGDMLFFSPYQPFMLIPDHGAAICALYWHPDFFCIEKHKNEVACNGVLFNNPYDAPSISVAAERAADFDSLIELMQREMTDKPFALEESLVASLKLFLIHASRIKMQQSTEARPGSHRAVAGPLLKFKEMIEKFYRQHHAAGDYAELLGTTTKALGRLTKNHFNKTVTELIQERIVIEAKRELYLTDKSVKEISYELGFTDQYYFSRVFKNVCDVSPQAYRDTVGHGRMTS